MSSAPLDHLLARLGFPLVAPAAMLGHNGGPSLDDAPRKLGRDDLRHYQNVTVDLIKTIWAPDGPPSLILAYDMGSGKTVSTLTALRDMLDAGVVRRVLIVAPLFVAEATWPDEIEAWRHTCETTYSVITGDAKRRAARCAEATEIHIVNKENLPWLWAHFGNGKRWPYDTIVIDEASMLKNAKMRTPKRALTRFGVLVQARKKTRAVIELTGTPAPNGLQNLYGLSYIVDQGERLGRNKTQFMDRWFNQNNYTYEVTPKPGAEAEIMRRLSDVMFSLNPKDYAELPKLVENEIRVRLPPKVMDEYHRFRRNLVSDVYDIDAVNAAVLTNKLLQFANGSAYQEDGNHVWIHDCKIDALEGLHAEANGMPLLVAYSFRFDLERIRKRFPKAVVLNEAKDVRGVMHAWNRSEIDMILAHPASAGHGLNIQKGSNISVWYGLNSDLELFQQFNKRLWRSGQKHEVVFSHRIVAEGTHDERILPILCDKDAVQHRIFEATYIEIS